MVLLFTMGGIKMATTKQIVQEYIEQKFSNAKTDANRFRSYYDRDEIYEYEKKTGKTIFRMSKNEIYDMIFTLDKRKGSITSRFFLDMSRFIQELFNYYTENYELITIPLTKTDVSLANIKFEYYNRNIPYVIKEDVEKIVSGLAEEDTAKSRWTECVVRLFYEGISNTKEIVYLKNEDVDLDKKILRVENRKIHISDRTCELLKEMSTSSVGDIDRGNKGVLQFKRASWNGGFFKFFVKEGETDDKEDSAKSKEWVLSKSVRRASVKYLNKPLSPKNIFGVGLYNRMCDDLANGNRKIVDMMLLDNGTPAQSRTIIDFLEHNAPQTMAKSKTLHNTKMYLLEFASAK